MDNASGEQTASERIEVNQLSAEQRRVVLPSFKEMISYVHEMAQKRLTNSSVQRFVYGRITIAYSYEVYTEVNFLLDSLKGPMVINAIYLFTDSRLCPFMPLVFGRYSIESK